MDDGTTLIERLSHSMQEDDKVENSLSRRYEPSVEHCRCSTKKTGKKDVDPVRRQIL